MLLSNLTGEFHFLALVRTCIFKIRTFQIACIFIMTFSDLILDTLKYCHAAYPSLDKLYNRSSPECVIYGSNASNSKRSFTAVKFWNRLNALLFMEITIYHLNPCYVWSSVFNVSSIYTNPKKIWYLCKYHRYWDEYIFFSYHRKE